MSSSLAAVIPEPVAERDRARRLGLYGLLAHWDEVRGQEWLPRLLEIEDAERRRRSLERRIRSARIGAFKPMADFDWEWPKKIHRPTIEELFTLQFVQEGANVVLLGPNGVGKSMIARNLAYQALLRGYTARFTAASDMLTDLAAQPTSGALARRLRRYCNPMLLCVDEVGYLSYDNRYADLLFEVVTRRYEQRSIVLTSNRGPDEWLATFADPVRAQSAIDRFTSMAYDLQIEGESYRG
ncbi:MAG: ATP-binding protein, partial [Candidatus Eisenbacteria bacterium]|nr:ATP-binding protein [Candidatus Eisenbacteria bacterium]